ncbi:MAG TPA: methylenetetrahydrofolate reductase [Acidimicrobiia bacterium]|nr:methylenetetrahydrofolate reductase [Acidimicrobiia bacterium]
MANTNGRRRLLENATFEVIPMKSTAEKARDLPAGATVSVTASPDKGMMATVELCESLAADGFRIVPHISARMLGSEQELREIVARLRDAGATRAFIIGGDAQEGTTYPDGFALLRALEDLDHPFTELGVAAYPEGHPSIPDGVLRRSLLEKQPHAHYMATQMCFDAGVIEKWLLGERTAGVSLPLLVGIPGVTDPARLVSIGARIGVGQSLRYLRKNRAAVLKLLRPGPFDPSKLVNRLAPLAEEEHAKVVGLHVFTFNQIAPTTAWYEKALS